MIDTTTKTSKVWYQAFLEKYHQSEQQSDSIPSNTGVSEHPVDEYQKLKHEHRQKIAASLLKEKDE